MSKFKNLTFDDNFKFLFSKELFLQDFVNSYYKYIKENKSYKTTKISSQEVIFPINNQKRIYYGDVVSVLDNDEIVILEMFRKFDINSYLKSKNYMYRLYSNQIDADSSIKYNKCKKVTCLNFITGNFRRCNNEEINSYINKNKITNIVLDDNDTEFVIIRIDKIRELEYTQNEEKFISWIRFISADSLEEMQKIAKGDEIMEQALRAIEKFFDSKPKPYDAYVREKEMYAEEKGEKRGKKLGRELGREQRNIEIAKNMLLNNEDINKIHNYTNLSIKAIEKLQKEMK